MNFREASPRLQPRIAALFYFLAVLTAVFGEFVTQRRLGLVAILIPVACYALTTLLLYAILRPVGVSVALLMASSSFVGLGLEVTQWQPHGVDIAMVFHGLYCLFAGYLVIRSRFLPRILGALMAFAALVWLLYLSPQLSNRLSPYNTAVGLLGEASLMLWLLVKGVNVERWKEQAGRTERTAYAASRPPKGVLTHHQGPTS